MRSADPCSGQSSHFSTRSACGSCTGPAAGGLPGRSSSMTKAMPTICGADLLNQFAGRAHRAAGGEEVVHHQDFRPGGDRIAVHLDAVHPVLQLVGLALRHARGACPSCGWVRTRRRAWPATAAPKMNPRASTAATYCTPASAERRAQGIDRRPGKPSGRASSGVMSRNRIPFFGQSGISRMYRVRSMLLASFISTIYD